MTKAETLVTLILAYRDQLDCRNWLRDVFASNVAIKCYNTALYMRLMGMIP